MEMARDNSRVYIPDRGDRAYHQTDIINQSRIVQTPKNLKHNWHRSTMPFEFAILLNVTFTINSTPLRVSFRDNRLFVRRYLLLRAEMETRCLSLFQYFHTPRYIVVPRSILPIFRITVCRLDRPPSIRRRRMQTSRYLPRLRSATWGPASFTRGLSRCNAAGCCKHEVENDDENSCADAPPYVPVK